MDGTGDEANVEVRQDFAWGDTAESVREFIRTRPGQMLQVYSKTELNAGDVLRISYGDPYWQDDDHNDHDVQLDDGLSAVDDLDDRQHEGLSEDDEDSGCDEPVQHLGKRTRKDVSYKELSDDSNGVGGPPSGNEDTGSGSDDSSSGSNTGVPVPRKFKRVPPSRPSRKSNQRSEEKTAKSVKKIRDKAAKITNDKTPVKTRKSGRKHRKSPVKKAKAPARGPKKITGAMKPRNARK